MKTLSSVHSLSLAVLAAMLSSAGIAGTVNNCDRVMVEVRTATEAKPQKVLVIVEDAMVANENCACEIVKAAILASQANEDLVKQIVLTATNVSPRQSSLIAECAAAVAPGQAVAIADTVKKAIGSEETVMKPDSIVPPSGSSTGEDYRNAPQDIRGVYLIQPATGGSAPSTTKEEKAVTQQRVVVKKVVVRRNPPQGSNPQSQSYAQIQ